MVRGRPIPPLALDGAERETLERWTRRPKTAQALALRARIVLACADGHSNTRVAADLRVYVDTVGKWRSRFLEQGLEGLLDQPRSGRPRMIDDADVERVIALTLETTPRDATHWSTRSMAQRSGLSHTTVSRIWRAFALQPHRTETLKLSADPLFIEKVRDIVGLYLDASTGKVIGQCHWRHRAVEFRKFFDAIESEVPAELDVHLIADNYATHKTPLIRNWFAKRPRFHIHFTPTSASWLDLVERWFGLLTEKQLRRGVHQSSGELEAAIYRYLDVTNEDPKHLVWTKTAGQILASVARFCQCALDTPHSASPPRRDWRSWRWSTP